MNQMNQLIMEGRIVKMGELKQTPAGSGVLELTVANERHYKNANGEYTTEVSYMDTALFGRTAEFAVNKLKKGDGIRIVGRLKQDRWKNSEGKSMSRIKVIAEHIDGPIQLRKQAEPEKAEEKTAFEQDEDEGIEY